MWRLAGHFGDHIAHEVRARSSKLNVIYEEGRVGLWTPVPDGERSGATLVLDHRPFKRCAHGEVTSYGIGTNGLGWVFPPLLVSLCLLLFTPLRQTV